MEMRTEYKSRLNAVELIFKICVVVVGKSRREGQEWMVPGLIWTNKGEYL